MTSVLRSSSSRRETVPENRQSKKIGCMSGLFHLLHTDRHDRKRLTAAAKKDKSVISPKKLPPPAETPGHNKEPGRVRQPEDPPSAVELRRFSCDVPRSPTIAPEIRRSNSVNSPSSLRRQPALVARLMGLEKAPEVAQESPESSSEKRRKLLVALEKCDEDLKALKKIIDAVRESEERKKLEPETVVGLTTQRRLGGESRVVTPVRSRAGPESKGCFLGVLNGGDLVVDEKKGVEPKEEQPSPVSVLDGISSPFKRGIQCKKSKDDDLNGSLIRRIRIEPLPRSLGRKGDGLFDYLNSTLKMVTRQVPSSSSKTLIESVNEVWKDGIWQERWELGRLVVGLEGDIFGELVEETVRELGFRYKRSLPFDRCRKRLYL